MDSKKPLSGVRVVDFSTHAAGPGAARILADQGADVVKIESLEGDLYRPTGAVVGCPATETENPTYDIENVNKKHISLDLKTAQGQEIIHRLLEKADILITTFRDSALEKLGLSYEQLSVRYPRLVYGHIKGYGEKGPEADRPGYDMVAYFARSGMMLDSVAEGQMPMFNVGACGDHPTALALAQGVVAALVRQMRTGKGDKVTTSLYHTGIWTVGTLLTMSQFKSKFPVPYNQPPISPVVHPYKCADGAWVIIMLLDFDKYWLSFCQTIERPDLAADSRFSNHLLAKKNQRELVEILSEAIGSKPYSEWAEKWKKKDIPFELLRHIADVISDETARLNNFIHPVTYPSGRSVYLPTPPIQFREMGHPECKPTTGIGSDTIEVMEQLGYSLAEIEEMKNNGGIRCRQ